jgi:hypothetical protein
MPPSISEQLARQSVVPMHSTIPPDMTVAQWRRWRSATLRAERRNRRRSPTVASGLSSVPAASCDHLHDSTTRYDHDRKLLTFLLVCPVCGTERVMETQHYEPGFQPGLVGEPGNAPAGTTVHALPGRRHEVPTRRAA